jgi:aminoglycoside phosphotransferase (APT) family kinase protein
VFAWGDGLALRLARDPSAAGLIEREALALAAAGRTGAPVPAVHERLTVDGRPGVVVDRVDGVDLLTWLGRRPWGVRSVGRTLGRQHARLHEAAGDGLPALREELAGRLLAPLVPADVRRLARARLDGLPDGDRLLHGDLHPGNVLRTARGCLVIDWTNGARGEPAADVARTVLLLRIGGVAGDAPAAVRLLAPLGRRVLAGAYVHAYARERPLDMALVGRWLPVCAAARLAEDVARERPALLALARRGASA